MVVDFENNILQVSRFINDIVYITVYTINIDDIFFSIICNN